MRRNFIFAGVILISSLHASPPSLARTVESAQSKACWSKAAQQSLTGEQRKAFHITCLKGSLNPKKPTASLHPSAATQAIVAPAGDRTTRSQSCNAEADKRGLQGAAYQSFRKGCLASAAPVDAIETGLTPTKPTKAKPKIETLTNTQPH